MRTMSNARMEAELTSWLRGLEPAGTPVALRVEAFADLRAEEAERGDGALAWLKAALSPVASLGGVVASAGLVLLLAVAGAALDHSGGPQGAVAVAGSGDPSGPIGMANPMAYAPNPILFLLLIAVSGLVGVALSQRRVWDVLAVVVLGTGEAEPAARPSTRSWLAIPRRLWHRAGSLVLGQVNPTPLEPLPLRQAWRTVPRFRWALVAATIVIAVLSIRLLLSQTTGYSTPLYIIGLCGVVVGSVLIVAYTWRYPARDRGGRLLLIGALAILAYDLSFITAYDLQWLFQTPVLQFLAILNIVSAAAVAAGLANRSGYLSRPPLIASTIGIGVTFFMATSNLILNFVNLSFAAPLGILPDYVIGAIEGWLTLLVMLAIMWIGLSAWRRGGSWGWKLVFAYGGLLLMASLPSHLLLLYSNLIDSSWSADIDFNWFLMWLMSVTSIIGSTGLLLALLSGLRPAPEDNSAPYDEPITDGAVG
jgi:hypothetical protein